MELSMLKQGDLLKSAYDIQYEVIRLLGSGGQGEVYEIAAGSRHYALKWYFPHMSTKEQKAVLLKLLETGRPDERFLWPLDYIEQNHQYGYVMPLRPAVYKNIVDLMKRKAEPSFRALCRAGYELSDAFQKLHSMGYSYGDISFGNAFLNPEDGSVLICDNDNVVVNGQTLDNVQGTLGFMAPEIIRGEKSPSRETDLFSLAVLLFYLFMLHHPLEGAREAQIKCLDLKAREKLYGREPLFIWDPEDRSNRPIAGYQDNAIIYWKLYPNFIKELFLKAFTEGMLAPGKRVVENQWKRAFIKLQDSIMICPECGAENFYENQKEMGARPICWACNQSIMLPVVLHLNHESIVLGEKTTIYRHQLEHDFNFKEEVARVSQHPKDPRKWGLQNVSDSTWQVKRSDGSVIEIAPGKSISLSAGLTIQFDDSGTGTIEEG